MSADGNASVNNATFCRYSRGDYKQRKGDVFFSFPPRNTMESVDLDHAGTVLAQATLTADAISLIVVGESTIRSIGSEWD